MRSTERRLLVLALLAAGTLCGCAGNRVPRTRPPEVDTAVEARLAPGDTFEVNVYEEKELSGKYQVAEDGTINFPFIGQVKAEGRAPMELAQDIQNALRDKQVLRSPSVSVFVMEYASKRVTVVGAVIKPGAFTLTPGLTAVQAISLAGGFTQMAKQNDVVITRRGADGKLVRYTVAVGAVSEGRADDVVLQPGDLVFVPEALF